MKRSAGITMSAVVVFAGSALTLLFGALMGFSIAVAVPNGSLPHGFGYFGFVVVAAMAVFAVWGIVSGVGLLKLREWSRVSMLVFASILLAVSIPGLLLFLTVGFSAMTNSPNPQLTRHVLWVAGIVISGFYVLLSCTGVLWLYYFSRQRVKTQFAARQAPTLAGMASASLPGNYSPARPLSISIIAGLMVLGVLSFPMLLVLHLPIMFLGYFFIGPKALAIILGYTVAQIAIAYGLWELRPWGRSLAIYYFNFAIFNSVISVILPGALGRYETAMAGVQSVMGAPATPMQIPIWLTLIFALPIIGIQLAFVIASKKAFEDSGNSSPSQ